MHSVEGAHRRPWLAALLAVACAGFDPGPTPAPNPIEQAIGLVERSAFAPPRKLRPCCAFGYELTVEVGHVPIPAFEVQNVVDPGELGLHTYDGGLVSTRNAPTRAFLSAEANGLVYTCRGGFIDVAHVRDYADWTAFLATRLEMLLDSGGFLDLGDEAGRRFVYLGAVAPDRIGALGRRRLAVALARWLAFELSVWHEVATWYGFASIGLFPERASAFSPEDLYSNLTGIELASSALLAGPVDSEVAFNRAMDVAIAERLRALGAQPPGITIAALQAVDGRWWDSSRRVPETELVRRRAFDLGPELAPWQIPTEAVTFALADACASADSSPLVLRNAESLGELRFDATARLDVRVDLEVLDADFAAPGAGPWVTQADLPRLVARARAANRERFGEDADRP